mgnify:CR=1 FL=1
MTLAQAIALVWIQRSEIDERDAHEVATWLVQEIKSIKREIRDEIRRARKMGADRYQKEVQP